MEKHHRLPLKNYRGITRATFTICVKDKKCLFTDSVIVDKFLKYLDEAIKKYACKNLVYVFMPDHLHIVLEGNCADSDVWKSIVLFKQKTGFWLRKNKPGFHWQKDFFDYLHRKEDDFKKHITYILNNPTRKGLAADWQDYQFKGSLDYPLEEILD